MQFRFNGTTAALVVAIVIFASVGQVHAQQLSDGAQQVLDKALEDQSAAREACGGGRDGVTDYIREVVTAMMQSGVSLAPSIDGSAAGEALGEKCASL